MVLLPLGFLYFIATSPPFHCPCMICDSEVVCRAAKIYFGYRKSHLISSHFCTRVEKYYFCNTLRAVSETLCYFRVIYIFLFLVLKLTVACKFVYLVCNTCKQSVTVPHDEHLWFNSFITNPHHKLNSCRSKHNYCNK